MTAWRDHQRKADDKLFIRHGDAAVYTPAVGNPVNLIVLIEKDFEILDAEGGVAEYIRVIRYRLIDLASHEIGAVVTIDGTTYKLGKTISDDGFIRTVQALT
jgi:hypothetical protein